MELLILVGIRQRCPPTCRLMEPSGFAILTGLSAPFQAMIPPAPSELIYRWHGSPSRDGFLRPPTEPERDPVQVFEDVCLPRNDSHM